jgi:drug/metabolite transporter (DMT)-like permease
LQKGEGDRMKTYAILGSFVSLIGYAIIFIAGGWLLTLGVLLAIWGNNLERKRDMIK